MNDHQPLVDPIDSDLLEMNWYVYQHRSTLYAVRRNKRIHRIIMGRILGRSLLRNELVDHIDGNGLNNHRSNLRLASIAENCRNSRKPKRNTSGYKGVSFHKKSEKWVAQITVDGENHNLGLYDTPKEAAIAYNIAAILYFGEFANVNDIPEWQFQQVKRIKANERPQKNSSSSYLGVTRRGSKWRARVTINGKRLNIGSFATPEEAYKARCEALAVKQ